MKLQQNGGMSDEGVLLDELEKLGKNTYMRKSECVDSWFVINWCPVIVSKRQQVSPILSLAVISLLIDQ